MEIRSSKELDELDRAILHELKEDGRRSFRKIGRNLDTAEATIRARVKRMQDQNILRIVAFADPESLGQTQLGLVFLEVDPKRHEAIVETIGEFPEVTYISTVLARMGICIEILSTDNASLWHFLNQRIGSLEGVRSMETMSVVKVHKLRYGSPTVRETRESAP